MRLNKTTKIVVLLLVMFVTAYPTFLALATVQFLIWFYFSEAPFGNPLGMHPSGYYLLPIIFACAIAFFFSLVMLIKTIKSKEVKM